MAKKITVPKSSKELPLAIIKQMLTLATSGFGLVAALAWNNVIKESVETFIKPHLPEGSNVVSLLIYALIVTTLAVLVTLQLTRIEQRLTAINEKISPKKKKN